MALGRDDDSQLGRHVGEELDRDGVAADTLDRLERELAAVDPDLFLLPETVGDVRRRDRAEQRSRRPRIRVEAQLELREPVGDRARLVDGLRLVPRALRVAPLELAHQAGRRRLGESARQQVVACVAARDADDLSAQADLVDVLTEDDLHQRSSLSRPRSPRSPRPPLRSSRPSATYGSSAISRARLTATATCR